MQKFTVFSIILSISVVLMVLDLVVHDYMSVDTENNPIGVSFEVPTVADSTENTGPAEEASTVNDEVSLTEEPEAFDIDMLEASIDELLLTQAGFESPTLKDSIFSGMVFQFISFSDQTNAFIHQYNFFDGSDFVGSIYEMKYPSETGSLQGYLSLRGRAEALTDLGEVNEANNYGDNASFYFNHSNKSRTVHLVIRQAETIYAFEYAYIHHEKMKKLFDLL